MYDSSQHSCQASHICFHALCTVWVFTITGVCLQAKKKGNNCGLMILYFLGTLSPEMNFSQGLGCILSQICKQTPPKKKKGKYLRHPRVKSDAKHRSQSDWSLSFQNCFYCKPCRVKVWPKWLIFMSMYDKWNDECHFYLLAWHVFSNKMMNGWHQTAFLKGLSRRIHWLLQ